MSDQSYLEGYAVDTDVYAEVGKLVKILGDKESAIKEAEANLKSLKAEKLQLQQVTIPTIFKSHSIDNIGLTGGIDVTIGVELTCEPVKNEEGKKVWLTFLENNGGEELKKKVLTIEDPSAALLQLLSSKGVVYEMGQTVNTNSLKAWFREKLGLTGLVATLTKEEVPKEFGLWVYDMAKIKVPK
jgi:hypothetical protein